MSRINSSKKIIAFIVFIFTTHNKSSSNYKGLEVGLDALLPNNLYVAFLIFGITMVRYTNIGKPATKYNNMGMIIVVL